jgi:acyl dehydratase
MASLLEELGWKNYIGYEYPSHTGEPVLARDIRRYALAIDEDNPIFYDEAAAKAGPYGGLTAPLNYISWSVGV